MRHGFVLAALLLPLTGCYAPPQDAGYGYAQPGYPAGPGYGGPPPGYPPDGYAAGPYDGPVYPGYSEYGGVPTIIEGGAPMPLILMGGSWGYYDSGRRWHRAPDSVSRHLQQRGPGGGGYRDGGNFRGPDGRPPGGPGPDRGQTFFRPNEQPRPQGRPPGNGAPPAGQTFFHPAAEQPRPEARPPGGGGPPAGQSFFRANPPPAPAPRPAPPPPPAAAPPAGGQTFFRPN